VAIESFAAISAVVTAIIPTQPPKRKFDTPSPINSAFKLSHRPGKWVQPGKTLAIPPGKLPVELDFGTRSQKEVEPSFDWIMPSTAKAVLDGISV
jgi:hypothetical protein